MDTNASPSYGDPATPATYEPALCRETQGGVGALQRCTVVGVHLLQLLAHAVRKREELVEPPVYDLRCGRSEPHVQVAALNDVYFGDVGSGTGWGIVEAPVQVREAGLVAAPTLLTQSLVEVPTPAAHTSHTVALGWAHGGATGCDSCSCGTRFKRAVRAPQSARRRSTSRHDQSHAQNNHRDVVVGHCSRCTSRQTVWQTHKDHATSKTVQTCGTFCQDGHRARRGSHSSDIVVARTPERRHAAPFVWMSKGT